MTAARRLRLVVLAVALCLVTVPHAQAADVVLGVGAIAMTVADADRSADFYANVLGFERVSDVEVWGRGPEALQGVFGLRLRVIQMRLGDEAIELHEYLTPAGRLMPRDSAGNDRWFQHVAIIVSDMDRAYERLRAFRVRHASPAPQRLPDWNANAGGIRAFYFRDPDGHFLEILWFPADKGDAKWHRSTDRLFLGIDHTAIVVEDTERSLRFYRDALGLTVKGESENSGPEQEWLNGVPGARLRITTLRAARGPGIELLEYRAPRGGRPVPTDFKSNDIAHWQIQLAVAEAAAAHRAAQGGNGSAVSPGAVTLADSRLGFVRGSLVRDPDGHAVQLVERHP